MDDENQPPGEVPLYDITISRDEGLPFVDESRLSEAIRSLLSHHDCSGASLSVALVSDAQIAEINEKYLTHTGPTDVISFDLSDEESDSLDGELVISVDTAGRQAESRGHSLEAETLLYAIHGTLHLLGFDDLESDDAARMHAEEDRMMTSLGYGAVFGS